jgi:hypothetical protein
MPLRDHFRSPVNDTHSWDEVHGGWPMEIVRDLTTILPVGFRAAPKVHLGSAFEVDVSTPDLDSRDPDTHPASSAGGTATLTALSPALTVEVDLSEQDEYEVRIYDVERGRQLVAAIEIVSPSNKDRPDTRELFVGKVVSLLQQGVCVSLVDLVSVRQANLYSDLLRLLGRTDPALAPPNAVPVRGHAPPPQAAQTETVARRLVLPHDRRTISTHVADLAHSRSSRDAPARNQLRRNLQSSRDCVK